MELNYHHEQANSEVILWIYKQSINIRVCNSRIQNRKVETTGLDKLGDQAHLANSGR